MADSVDGSSFQHQPQQLYHGQPWDVPVRPQSDSPAAATRPHSADQQHHREVPIPLSPSVTQHQRGIEEDSGC